MKGGRNKCCGRWRQNGSIKENFVLMKELDSCYYKTRINTHLCDVPQSALFYSGHRLIHNEVVIKVWAALPYMQIHCVEDAHKIQWSMCIVSSPLYTLWCLVHLLCCTYVKKKKKKPQSCICFYYTFVFLSWYLPITILLFLIHLLFQSIW